MKNQETYSAALEELQQIVMDIETGEISVDELSEKVKRATALIRFCKSRLSNTEADVNRLLQDLENISGDDSKD